MVLVITILFNNSLQPDIFPEAPLEKIKELSWFVILLRRSGNWLYLICKSLPTNPRQFVVSELYFRRLQHFTKNDGLHHSLASLDYQATYRSNVSGVGYPRLSVYGVVYIPDMDLTDCFLTDSLTRYVAAWSVLEPRADSGLANNLWCTRS